MFAAGTTDLSGTLQETRHRPVTFECGFEVSGDVAVSQDLVSQNCHRIQLQTVGTSTFPERARYCFSCI